MTSPPTRPQLLIRICWALALMLPGALALQPVFGGSIGILPGLAGVVAGVAIGGLSAWRRWTLLPTLLLVLAAYFLLGGAVALRPTTIAGVVPTVETLRSLLLLIVQSWRDLLTVATPAGDFTGPMVMPWLAGLVLGCVATTIIARTSRHVVALLTPMVWLVVGIAFGVRDTPAAILIGVLLGALSLGWLVWVQLTTVRNANDEVLANPRSQRGPLLRRAAAAAAVVLVASGFSYAAIAATSDRVNRQVLRDHVAPPLNLADYPTPLAKFRLYETDLKEKVLMTVTGLPADTRLRLATMDTYDGTVYNVSRITADYVRVGRQIGGQDDTGVPAEVSIEIGEYDDVWLPLAGTPHRITFDSDDARRQADGLHFNRATDSSLTTARVAAGDVITLSITASEELSSADAGEAKQLGAGQMLVPQAAGVPDNLGTFASDALSDEGTAFEQMLALETVLREGSFSFDDGISRSSHTNGRLTDMFTAPAPASLIGDDEQYAPALALMANQLGIPTRVVLGFDPGESHTPGEPWEVKGGDARVWVESFFDHVGWVRFEPTPDRDRTPQVDTPKPQPEPRPVVEPPPNPPELPPVEPNLATDGLEQEEGDESETRVWFYLAVGAATIGVIAALASPFVLILLAKSRRRRRRRSEDAVRAQLAGAWDEILDQARDLGGPQQRNLTRREGAARLGEQFGGVQLDALADTLDHGTFAPEPPLASLSDSAWGDATTAMSAMAAATPWHRRLRARFSLKSLRHRRQLEREQIRADRAAAERVEAASTTMSRRRRVLS